MQDKQAYVYDVFENVAQGYDKANARISLGRHVRWKRAAVRLLGEGLPAKPHILDVGCGTGDMLLLVSQEIPDARLVGLDFSPHMLEQARMRCSGLSELELVQGNALELPFDDASFDGATIAFALRNTADYGKVLLEIGRVLKPGGTLVCIDSFVPSSVLVRPFYHLYFSFAMPLLGGGIRNWRRYRWLSSSTKKFVSVEQLCALMNKAGFVNPRCETFMLGASACICATTSKEVPYRGDPSLGTDAS